MNASRASRARFGALLLLGLAACGGGQSSATAPNAKPDVTPVASSSAGPSASTDASAPPPASSAATADAGVAASPLAAILTTDPKVLGPLLEAAQKAPEATLAKAGTANDPIEAGIKANAATAAKGLSPQGPIAKADLKEGGHASMLVTLEAGKCYAIVGFAPKGSVHDLDLRLLAPPFYSLLSGEDTTDDNTPVIGRAPNPMCPLLSSPMPYKVDIHAQKGQGPVGVQLYSMPAK